MPAETWYRDGRREIEFISADFVEAAIKDFLESGTNTSRMAGAILQVATAVELLLKNYLEKICPALILDKIDDAGLQVAKLYDLGKVMISPKELDATTLKTASFSNIIQRVGKFMDLSKDEKHLRDLQNIRNALVHHRRKVEVLKVNLLLARHIFPFVRKLGQMDRSVVLRITSETWDKIQELERLSVSALASQIAKRIAHFSNLASEMSEAKTLHLAKSIPELNSKEDITSDDLSCLACHRNTATIFRDIDVDVEDGEIVGAYATFRMTCRVCEIEFDYEELNYIVKNFEKFAPENSPGELERWTAALELDTYDEYS